MSKEWERTMYTHLSNSVKYYGHTDESSVHAMVLSELHLAVSMLRIPTGPTVAICVCVSVFYPLSTSQQAMGQGDFQNMPISGASDNTVRIWDTGTRRPKSTMVGHLARVTALAVSKPHGGMLVTGSWDYTVGLWNAKTGKCLARMDDGHCSDVSAVLFGNAEALSTGQDCRLCRWDCRRKALVSTVTAGVGGITCMAPLAGCQDGDDLSVVATGSDSGTVLAVDTRSGDVVRSFDPAGFDGESCTEGARVGRPGHDGLEGTVRCLAVMDGVLYVGTSGDIHIFDFGTGALMSKLTGHISSVTTMAPAPGGEQLLYSASWDGTVREWNTRTWTASPNYLVNYNVLFNCMAVGEVASPSFWHHFLLGHLLSVPSFPVSLTDWVGHAG